MFMSEFIMQGYFAKLSPSAARMLYVIEHVKNHKTNEFFHRVELLAEYAGLSRSYAFVGLAELLKWNIISRKKHPGKSSTYVWHPELAKKPEAQPVQEIWTDPSRKSGRHPSRKPGHVTTDLNRSFITTTNVDNSENSKENVVVSVNSVEKQELTAADKIQKSLINEMRSKYGSDIVEDVLIAMENFNGEIKNPGGYFRSCCQRGVIPTSKIATERRDKQVFAARAAEARARAAEERKLEDAEIEEKWKKKTQAQGFQEELARVTKMLTDQVQDEVKS